jgi:hypothetical protein
MLSKVAYNHNQHYPQARSNQSFSGPADMVNQSFGDIFQIPAVRLLLGITALIMVLNFAKDQIDKLERKSKNNRK